MGTGLDDIVALLAEIRRQGITLVIAIEYERQGDTRSCGVLSSVMRLGFWVLGIFRSAKAGRIMASSLLGCSRGSAPLPISASGEDFRERH